MHTVHMRTLRVLLGLLVAGTSFVPAASAIQVTVFPAVDEGTLAPGDIGSYSFHLEPFNPDALPQTFPCGKPFSLPTGGFYAWVEGPNWISARTVLHGPEPTSADAEPREFHFHGGPAGSVALDADVIASLPDRVEIRLLSIDSHIVDRKYLNEFARVVDSSHLSSGVLMPAGPVVATVVDIETKRHLLVSKPQRVEKGKRRPIVFPEVKGGALIARIERAEPLEEVSEDDVAITFAPPDGQALSPDVLVPAMGRVYAIWYDLEQQTGSVEVASSKFWTKKIAVHGSHEGVEYVSGRLVPRASLNVSVLIPDDLDGEQTTIAVRDANGTVATVEPEPRFPCETTIDGLPRSVVTVDAIVGPWLFEGQVDLEPGDGHVVIAPEAARVRGIVTVGDEPASASVGFLTNRSNQSDEVATSHATDEWGEFEAVLFPLQIQPIALVSIDQREPIWWWLQDLPIRDGDYLELAIQGHPVDLRIVDAKTAVGIPDAQVAYGWEGTGGGGRQSQSDAEGRVRLPPVPAEELHVMARAQGYEPGRTLIRTESETTEHEFTLQLEPESDGDRTTVLLHTDAPAIKAEVALIPDGGSEPRWVKATDSQGTIVIEPEGPNEIVAIRHPQAAAAVLWSRELQATDTIRLPPIASPLAVRVVEPSGAAVPYARLVLWLRGFRISGGFLAWLTEAGDATNRAGLWNPRNIPSEPIEILACELSHDSDLTAEFASGGLDYRRVSVALPRSGPVTIEAILR
jgi:hypothetical protein